MDTATYNRIASVFIQGLSLHGFFLNGRQRKWRVYIVPSEAPSILHFSAFIVIINLW